MRHRTTWSAALVALATALAAACRGGQGTAPYEFTSPTPDTHLSFPIATGPHAVDCYACHGTFPSFKQFDCLGCHAQAPTAAVHPGVDTYLYDSTACYGCHKDSGRAPLRSPRRGELRLLPCRGRGLRRPPRPPAHAPEHGRPRLRLLPLHHRLVHGRRADGARRGPVPRRRRDGAGPGLRRHVDERAHPRERDAADADGPREHARCRDRTRVRRLSPHRRGRPLLPGPLPRHPREPRAAAPRDLRGLSRHLVAHRDRGAARHEPRAHPAVGRDAARGGGVVGRRPYHDRARHVRLRRLPLEPVRHPPGDVGHQSVRRVARPVPRQSRDRVAGAARLVPRLPRERPAGERPRGARRGAPRRRPVRSRRGGGAGRLRRLSLRGDGLDGRAPPPPGRREPDELPPLPRGGAPRLHRGVDGCRVRLGPVRLWDERPRRHPR